MKKNIDYKVEKKDVVMWKNYVESLERDIDNAGRVITISKALLTTARKELKKAKRS